MGLTKVLAAIGQRRSSQLAAATRLHGVGAMKSHHGALRVGRVARWQRWMSYATLGVCAVSGLVWFVLMDGAGMEPPQLVFWWIIPRA